MQMRCRVWSMMIIALSLYLAWLYKATHIKGIVCCCSVAVRLRDEIWNFTMVMSKFHLSVEWKHTYSSIIIYFVLLGTWTFQCQAREVSTNEQWQPWCFSSNYSFLSSHISNMLYNSSVVIFHYKLHSLLFYVQHIFFFGSSSQATVYFLVCSS